MAEQPKKASYTDHVDKLFEEEFGNILAKDPLMLTEYDKQFLVGRRHLLNKDQQEKFGHVIDETLKRNLAATGTDGSGDAEAGDEPKPKRTKKAAADEE